MSTMNEDFMALTGLTEATEAANWIEMSGGDLAVAAELFFANGVPPVMMVACSCTFLFGCNCFGSVECVDFVPVVAQVRTPARGRILRASGGVGI